MRCELSRRLLAELLCAVPARCTWADAGYGAEMALIKSSGFAHVRLTVTDINRSKTFYDQVFGWPVAVDASASADEPEVRESAEKFYGGVVYQTPQGTLFGLRPVPSMARGSR
jgi:hypothetical protein